MSDITSLLHQVYNPIFEPELIREIEEKSMPFNATAGQAITIDLVRYDFSLTLVSMRVEEAGGTSLLDRWLGFGSANLTLEQGGAYRLVIGSDLEPGTGTYQIRLQPQ